MIPPIKITDGINKAVVNFVDNGVTAKFEKANPEFQVKVAQYCDEFIHSSDKTQKAAEGLLASFFKRSK